MAHPSEPGVARSPLLQQKPDFIFPEGDNNDQDKHGTLYTGRSRFFTYDGSGLKDKKANSCGQQAMASILDFWNCFSFGFQRGRSGPPPAQDGRLHYPPEYVQSVFEWMPPLPVGEGFTMPHQLENGFKEAGLTVEGCHSGAFGNGEAELAALKKWVGQYRIPAVCLLDLNAVWPGEGNTYHYGIIPGYSADTVLLASWENMYQLSWKEFMQGWHCAGLNWPFNYNALLPYRAAKP